MDFMHKVRNFTFAATVAVLLLTGFPRRAAAASDSFLTLGGVKGESNAQVTLPLAPIVSAVLLALSTL